MAGRSTARGLFLLSILVFVFLSVRPVAPVELALDAVLMPVRVLAELARPIGWLRVPVVRAADRRLTEMAEDDYASRRELFSDGVRYAVPRSAELRAGRRFVLAEVVDRDAKNEDRIVIELHGRSCAGIEPGMPVVSGEAFVGRVRAVDTPDLGHATVDLVTGRDFFVGAELELPEEQDGLLQPTFEPLRLVVGGVVSSHGGADYRLAIHNPSRQELPLLPVHVDESLSGTDEHGRLAAGFELGPLVELDDESLRPPYGIEPRVDYRSGLFQVAVVCPADSLRHTERAAVEDLDDGRWRSVFAISSGDPSGWREGLKLGAGTLNGVSEGAAVVSGPRLVGRVRRASPLCADVSLLGDPGLWVPAIARVEGRERPLVLGRLVALGRDGRGARTLRFHWDAQLEWDGDASGAAEIFTGSGERLIPRGLLLGTTELPVGPGPHVLRIEQPVDTSAVRKLWVRLPAPESTESDREREGGP